MKVLALVGTKRKNGLVSRLCEKILEGAEENGHQIELVNLYDYRLELLMLFLNKKYKERIKNYESSNIKFVW